LTTNGRNGAVAGLTAAVNNQITGEFFLLPGNCQGTSQGTYTCWKYREGTGENKEKIRKEE